MSLKEGYKMPSIEIYRVKDALIYSGYEGLVYEKIDDKTYRRVTDPNYLDKEHFKTIEDTWSSYINNRTLTIVEKTHDIADIYNLIKFINELDNKVDDLEYTECKTWDIVEALLELISKTYGFYRVDIWGTTEIPKWLLYLESREGYGAIKRKHISSVTVKNLRGRIVPSELDFDSGYFRFTFIKD
jgi:hypothetical protein